MYSKARLDLAGDAGESQPLLRHRRKLPSALVGGRKQEVLLGGLVYLLWAISPGLCSSCAMTRSRMDMLCCSSGTS